MTRIGLADSPLFIKSKKKVEKQPIHHDAMTPRNQNTMIAEIANALQYIGKEASTHRLTKEEKDKIFKMIISFRKYGIRLSENQIIRTALNYLLWDYSDALKFKESIIFKVVTSSL